MTKKEKAKLARDVMAALKKNPDEFPEVLEMPHVEGYHGKLTADRGTFILRKIWGGAYYQAAADAARVTDRTFRRWKKRGRKGIYPFDEFLERLKFADGHAHLLFDSAAVDMSKRSPDMLKWVMRLRWPKAYGEASQVDGKQLVVYLPEKE